MLNSAKMADEESLRRSSNEQLPPPVQHSLGPVLWGPMEKWGTVQPGVQPNLHNTAACLLQVPPDPRDVSSQPVLTQGTPMMSQWQDGQQLSLQPWQAGENPVLPLPIMQRNPVINSMQGTFPGQHRYEITSGSHTAEPCVILCETVSSTNSEKLLNSCQEEVVVLKVEPESETQMEEQTSVDRLSNCPSTGVVPVGSTSCPVRRENGPVSNPITNRPLTDPITVEDVNIIDLWRTIRVTKGFSTDTDLAKFLLCVYVHFGDPDTPSSSAEHSTQTDGQCSQCSRLLRLVCINMYCHRSPLQSVQSPSSLQVQGQFSSTQSQKAYKRAHPSGLSSSLHPPPTTFNDSSENECDIDVSTVLGHSDVENSSDPQMLQNLPEQASLTKKSKKLHNSKTGLVPVVKLYRCDSPSVRTGNGYTRVKSQLSRLHPVSTTTLQTEIPEKNAGSVISSGGKALKLKAEKGSVGSICSVKAHTTKRKTQETNRKASSQVGKKKRNKKKRKVSAKVGNTVENNTDSHSTLKVSAGMESSYSENISENTISVETSAKQENAQGKNSTSLNQSEGETTGFGQCRIRNRSRRQVQAVEEEPVLSSTGKYPIADGIHYRSGRVPPYLVFSEFRCSRCDKTFPSKQYIHRHVKNPSCDTVDDELFRAHRSAYEPKPKKNSDDEWEPKTDDTPSEKNRRGSDGEWDDEERPKKRKSHYRTTKELTIEDFMAGKVQIPIGYTERKASDHRPFRLTQRDRIYSHYTCFECHTVFVPHEEFLLHQNVCHGKADKKTLDRGENIETSGQETGENEVRDQTSGQETGENEVRDQTSRQETGENEVRDQTSGQETGENEVRDQTSRQETGENEVRDQTSGQETSKNEVRDQTAGQETGENEVRDQTSGQETGENEVRDQTSGQETGENEVRDRKSLDEKGEDQQCQEPEIEVDKTTSNKTAQHGPVSKLDPKSIQILLEIKDRFLFCCHLCNRVFLNNQQRSRHIWSHDYTLDANGTYTCNFCGDAFTKFYYIYHHFKYYKLETRECAECGTKFKYGCQAQVHHNMHNTEEKKSCRDCGESLSGMSKAEVRAHVKKHKTVSTIVCSVCAKDVPRKNLKSHMVKHSEDRPFACTICTNKTFKYKPSLEEHMAVTHRNEEKQFQCEECGNKFASQGKLTQHRTRHLGLEFKCKECGKKLSGKAHLKNHILRVHRKDKRFPCKYCGLLIYTESELKIHMRSHTGEKPFQCTYCPSKFAQKGYLKKHIRLHTGEKPYKCDDCEKKFTDVSSLRNHRKKSHADKTFPCGFCEKVFCMQSSLDHHMYEMHDGNCPYKIFKVVQKRDDVPKEPIGTVRSETIASSPSVQTLQNEACLLSEESCQDGNGKLHPMLEEVDC